MRAAELFVRCLENEGVDTVFGLPGEENLDVLDALVESPIRFVTVRHEQGAALMADVYGRLTGRAGVCLASGGPGAVNLLTGADWAATGDPWDVWVGPNFGQFREKFGGSRAMISL